MYLPEALKAFRSFTRDLTHHNLGSPNKVLFFALNGQRVS